MFSKAGVQKQIGADAFAIGAYKTGILPSKKTGWSSIFFLVVVAATSGWYGYALGREQARRTLCREISELRQSLQTLETSQDRDAQR
jgi:hypothetical protein